MESLGKRQEVLRIGEEGEKKGSQIHREPAGFFPNIL